MLKFLYPLLALCVLLLSAPALPAQDHFVLFGGYSYLRPPVTVEEENFCPTCADTLVGLVSATNHQNLQGWEVTGTCRFLPFLGIAADFSGHYGSTLSGFSSNTHQHTFLFGPEVSLPSRVSPFAHVLFGASRQSVSAASPNAIPVGAPTYLIILGTSNTAFASAFGAGIDLKLIPHVWIRPIQIDYLVTRLNSSTQNQPRVSAGLVLHF